MRAVHSRSRCGSVTASARRVLATTSPRWPVRYAATTKRSTSTNELWLRTVTSVMRRGYTMRPSTVAVRLFCGDYERPRQLLDALDEGATPFLEMRCQLIRGLLAKRTERFGEAERYLRNARRLSKDLGVSFVGARGEFELADLLMSQERLDEAGTLLNSALDAFALMGQPEVEIEALALSAKLLATTGDLERAGEHAARAAARCTERRPQSYSEIAWNLASAFATIGDEAAAEAMACHAAATAVDDALRMPADLAETYLKLPWHQQTLAYLWDRPQT